MLLPIQLDALRPTQMTVGLREVERKRAEWRGQRDDAGKYLGRHMIPVVLGPKGKSYVIDHHHLARALVEEGQEEVLTTVIADLRPLSQDAFWVFLDNRGWLHPFDEHGQRRGYGDIPKRIRDLADDPFRSLAGAVRQAGGYAKETTPFSEFIWADYLRRLIKQTTVEKNFDKALDKALGYARSHEARFMPGWCGVDPDLAHHV